MAASRALYGITTGDASGVGPEILLKAFSAGEIRYPFLAYGDREALDSYNESLNYGVELQSIATPEQYQDGVLNVLDHALLRREDITPGKLNRKAGYAAREYVITATRAA